MEDTQTFLNFCFQLNCLFQDSESSLKFLLLTFQVEVAGRGACSSVCGVGHVMRNTLKGMPLIGWLQLNRRQTFRLEFLVVANRVHLRVPVTTGKIPQQKKILLFQQTKKCASHGPIFQEGGHHFWEGRSWVFLEQLFCRPGTRPAACLISYRSVWHGLCGQHLPALYFRLAPAARNHLPLRW